MRILAYLKGTRSLGPVYTKGDVTLSGAADADHAGDMATRRSTTGYYAFLNGTPVGWNSTLQRTVALSTAEAEMNALSSCVQMLLGLKNLLTEMGLGHAGILIDEDSESCIGMTGQFGPTARSKHMDVRMKFVREAVERGDIIVTKVDTRDQRADILTKALTKETFVRLRELTMK